MEKSQNKQAEAFKISGNWETQSKELRSKYPQLTETDLKFESGKENDLLKRVETRLGKNREEVVNILNGHQPKKA